MKYHLIDDGEKHWIAANNLDEAVSVIVREFDFKTVENYEKEYDGYEIKELDEDDELKIRSKYGYNNIAIVKTVREWLENLENPCLLASTVD